MPNFLHKLLAKSAAKKGLTGKAADRYAYGAMNNMGAMKGSKETAKGRAMEKKHDAKTASRSGVKRKGNQHMESSASSYNWRDHWGGKSKKSKSSY